jgi:signal transduction histidine kinase
MPATDKINILAVDDLAEKLLVYESVLADLGENVVTARSGEEALEKVLQHDFAVILLDVNMPGMDGLEVATLIRKRKKSSHIPIIFVTAYADELHTAQGYSIGAVDYILSPVVPEILRTKVKVFVDLYRMTQQVKRQAEERIALLKEQAARAAAEEANRRLAFLVRAGTTLGRSLDYAATARDLAQLVVPTVADLSVVTFLQPNEGDWESVLARVAAGGEVSLEEIHGWESLPNYLTRMINRVLASGAKEVLSPDSAGWADINWSAIVLPLQARGRMIGTLTLALEAASDRFFSPEELTMIDALAGHAAGALDNALLYSDIQRADRQKNQFLSMLAHELRNPLAPIRNAVHILNRKSPPDPDLQWARDVIDRQALQMTRLVDDLLDVSRITLGKIRLKMEPVEVSRIIHQAVETSRPLIDAREHQLSISLPTQPLWVEGDHIRLSQILTNLLNNAAKYTDTGGQIWVTAELDQDQVALRVKDTGIGIPKSMEASIFEIFTQVDCSLDRSQGGLGIGLTLARHLTQMHGGTIEVASPGLNQGSEFIIRLPPISSIKQAQPTDQAVSQPDPARKHFRVLVVDDNRDAAKMVALTLQLEGFDVRTAHDGPTALSIIPHFDPQLVLMDLGLPGMNGYEIARHLRKQPMLEDLVLVALTGYSQEEDRRKAKEAGFNHFVVKPIDTQTLHSLLPSLPRANPTPRSLMLNSPN